MSTPDTKQAGARQSVIRESILRYRSTGNKYAGRYIDFTARQIALETGWADDEKLSHEVYAEFQSLDAGRSLLDSIQLHEEAR